MTANVKSISDEDITMWKIVKFVCMKILVVGALFTSRPTRVNTTWRVTVRYLPKKKKSYGTYYTYELSC